MKISKLQIKIIKVIPICAILLPNYFYDLLVYEESGQLLWAVLHFSGGKLGKSYLYNNNKTLTNRKADIDPYFDHLSVRINLLFIHERRFSP